MKPGTSSDSGVGGPIEPPRTTWRMPDVARLGRRWAGRDLLGVGADLAPGTLLAAYRAGLFPMAISEGLGWWSPDPRGVLPLDRLVVSRSLRASCRRFTVTVDTAFSDVVQGCADDRRPDGWITEDFADAYGQLHALGWAHSVEVRTGGELVGGLYGVAAGGLFAGESMFHRMPDASKVALVALVQLMRTGGGTRVLDVQWATDHLRTLGAVEVPRREYLKLLSAALAEPELPVLQHPPERVVIES